MTAAASPTAPHRAARRWIATVLLVIVLAGLGAYGWHWHADRSYVGSTAAASLTWTCWNGIFWTDPDTGIKWWAGEDRRVIEGPIESATSGITKDQSGLPIRNATGSIHFDTRETATFTSAAGGHLPLTLPGARTGPVLLRRLRHLVRRLVVVTVAVLIVGAGLVGYRWWWHKNEAFVGTTVAADLELSCGYTDFWIDPDTGNRWEVEEADNSRVSVLAVMDASANPSTGHIPGTVHFNNTERATFTSDGATTATLDRTDPKPNRFTTCTSAISRPARPWSDHSVARRSAP